MLKKIRTITAAIVFALITLLFLDFTGSLHQYFGWLAKIQFVPAVLALNFAVILVMIAVTLVFGRVYCSVVCPLGIFQDIVSWFAGKRSKNRFRYRKAHKWLRYGLLVIFVLLMVLGLNAIACLIAPYSAFGRMASELFSPIYRWGNNALAYFAERADSYAFYTVDVYVKSLPTFIVAAVTFVAVFVLAWRGGRTYCNTVCPVGTFLGFISRYSFLKPVINTEKCNGCGKCARNCKCSCIDPENHAIDYSRCVACMDCISNCKQGAIKYTRKPSGKEAVVDKDRRNFLSVSVMLAATAVLEAQEKTTDGGLALIEEKQKAQRKIPVKPAGALSLKNFENHCTACQLCVSVCPNGVLRPSTSLENLMQPVVGYEKGYCRPECTRCSEVCPTGAITRVTKAEKSSIKTGTAVWIAKNCLPMTEGVSCGNCARHCPAGAIQMVPQFADDPNSPQFPVINEERCIGCGACENLCPARPFSAIYVEGVETQRTI